MDFSLLIEIINIAVIFLASFIALIVYLYSKRDKKIEAATILLNEIYAAEREIVSIKKNEVISDYTFILPSNHWNEFQYLFVKNFDSGELERVSDFFKSCSLAEESVNLIRSYLPISMNQKTKNIQDKLLNIIEKTTSKEEYEKEKEKILDIFHKEEYCFLPHTPRKKLFNYLQNINFISQTSIGEKFKNIRDAKWYSLFI